MLRSDPKERKVRAIVIYPMNALVNSQFKALQEYANGYSAHTGKPMLVRFGRYTGQESQEERGPHAEEVPHILLTNYMMLEMILLGGQVFVFVDRSNTGFQFLVLNELHMYRGRQGSDIALLIRRLRERCGNPEIIHIGTSATMVSSPAATPDERHLAVSAFASRLFGVEIFGSNVIEESLVPIVGFPGSPSAAILREAVSVPAPITQAESLANPLAAWIEGAIGIEREPSGNYRRPMPQTLDAIVKELATVTGLPSESCFARIREFLRAKFPDNSTRKQVFAFKLHQLISQGKPLHATLVDLSFEGQCSAPPRHEAERVRPMVPLEFCRNCGQEYYKVTWDKNKGVLSQWVNEYGDGEKDSQSRTGYLSLPGDTALDWSSSDLSPDLMEPNGRRVKRAYAHRVLEDLYVRTDGNITDETDLDALRAWFQPWPILICQSGGEYSTDFHCAEFRKLSGLANEGRSSATTTLGISVLANACKANISESGRKLLSFTDNRQDASLQSGHFNDFIQVCFIRSGIVDALERCCELRHDNIAAETFRSLNLRPADYAPNTKVEKATEQAKRIRDRFRELIEYRIYEDLRRVWRIVHPNPEQCAFCLSDIADSSMSVRTMLCGQPFPNLPLSVPWNGCRSSRPPWISRAVNLRSHPMPSPRPSCSRCANGSTRISMIAGASMNRRRISAIDTLSRSRACVRGCGSRRTHLQGARTTRAGLRAGALGALFCSPTMELRIDIVDLQLVHLRNAPPSPAGYAQCCGRAGRLAVAFPSQRQLLSASKVPAPAGVPKEGFD
jgi:hypothetical protein